MMKSNASAWWLHDDPLETLPSRSTPRIGVIWNPRSHRNVGTAPDPIAGPGISMATPISKHALARALERFAAQGIDALIVEGGDGTLHDVLTYGAPFFGDRWPRLVAVPRGKTNALSVDLGLSRDWTYADALAALAGGRTVTRRPIVIERPGDRALWGFIFGAGAFNAAIDTGQVAHRLGAFQSAAIGITFAMGLIEAVFGIGNGPWRRSAPMRLTDEAGETLVHSGRGDIETRYLALFSTLRRFPLGIAPFRESDSNIRFLLIDSPIRRVTGRLPMILSGREAPSYPALGIHRGSGTAFHMDLRDRFTLDGEVFGAADVVMREGPELEFVVP
jgi:diacylglycerol kinase (ATP)